MTNPGALRICRPVDLLAAVPYLLGFHPAQSVVVVGISARQLTFAARADLPPAGQPPGELADYLCDVVLRQDVHAAMLVGYGPADRVEPVLLAIRQALPFPVYEVLRATDGRFWSYSCADPSCCSPEGTPFDVTASEVAAAAAYSGAVALPDRAALAAQVAPIDGPARDAMRRATECAHRRLSGLTVGQAGRAGAEALSAAVERYRAGGVLTDDEVASLTVLLRQLPVRDRAWDLITEPELHVALWTDIARRAEPDLVAPPASLLAFAAWRAGDGALSAVAVERALVAEPTYSMALLVGDMLFTGTPPSTLDGWPFAPAARMARGRWRFGRRRRSGSDRQGDHGVVKA